MDQRHATAREPRAAAVRRHAGAAAAAGGHGLPQHSGRHVHRPENDALPVRLRRRLLRDRHRQHQSADVPRDHAGVPGRRAQRTDLSELHPDDRRRRQRHRGRAPARRDGAARDLYRLGAASRPAGQRRMRERRAIHPLRPNQGRASRRGRSAPLGRGALPDVRELPQPGDARHRRSRQGPPDAVRGRRRRAGAAAGRRAGGRRPRSARQPDRTVRATTLPLRKEVREEMRMVRRITARALAVVAVLASSVSADAKVVRIVVDSTVDIAGQPYQQLTGRAFGELDPADPLNALITDIELAPTNRDGKVTYIASFVIRKPKVMSTASGLMWHDVPNRGGNVAFNADLFAAGDVHLLSGWQGDNAGATRVPADADCLPETVPACTAPALTNHWVKTPVLTGVTGRIFGRIINRRDVGAQPLNVMGNPIPYFPVDPSTNSGATLTIHTKETINGVVTEAGMVPNGDWKFCGGGTFAAPLPVTTLPVQLCLNNGFDATKLYQLVYDVKDPYVLGVGTAAFRDVQSFFRYEARDRATPPTPNPLAGAIKWAIVRGSSQSGNFIRHFIHLGMNQDEAGRIVHEGAWPLIAGRRVANNSRWGQPDGVLELYQMGSEGPQWWTKYEDKVRDLPKRGILDRCKRTGTCPKIVETFGGAEVFALKMTTSWVGTDAKKDIPLPANVRRYYLPSSTHGGGSGAMDENPPNVGASCPGNNWGVGTLRANPVPSTALVNRMRVALRDWVMHGTPPPPSQWPTLNPLKANEGDRHDWDDEDDEDNGKARGHDDGDRDRDAKRQALLAEPTKSAMGFPSNVPG